LKEDEKKKIDPTRKLQDNQEEIEKLKQEVKELQKDSKSKLEL
jgi:hypothetical protein